MLPLQTLSFSFAHTTMSGAMGTKQRTPQDQVKQAVMSKSVGGMERSRLEQVFEFTYDVDMYEPFSK